MTKELRIGYDKALKLILETISPLPGTRIELAECSGRITSENLYSLVNSPSVDSSMKDGYAVMLDETHQATPQNPVELKIIGTAAAGVPANETITPGTTIRILTGAKIPKGANAVLAEEFSHRRGDVLTIFNTAEPGRNILPKGTDIKIGDLIATRGSCLSPGMIGLLAAAGHGELPVYHRPRVAILATGDELVIPGQKLAHGKLYASNLEMLKAWCLRYNMPTTFSILNDKKKLITETIAQLIETHDAVITSGGAWTGDKDFVAHAMDTLGWEKIFHSIRIGPGKAAGFGILNHKPVFLLPGGPPSNLAAFLQLALPGLLRLGGHKEPALPRIVVKLQDEVKGRNSTWTQFIYGQLKTENGHTMFKPLQLASRLKSMALAQGVIAIPEGVKSLPPGTVLLAQLLI